MVNRLKQPILDDDLVCTENLDLNLIESAEKHMLPIEQPSPVANVIQSEVSEGIEDFLAWRRNYGITDDSQDDIEHEVPTITFTDEIIEEESSQLEVGSEDCAAHIPPSSKIPKKMTISGTGEAFKKLTNSRNTSNFPQSRSLVVPSILRKSKAQ